MIPNGVFVDFVNEQVYRSLYACSVNFDTVHSGLIYSTQIGYLTWYI